MKIFGEFRDGRKLVGYEPGDMAFLSEIDEMLPKTGFVMLAITKKEMVPENIRRKEQKKYFNKKYLAIKEAAE
jgi:uncharacterized protein (UPF0147 family)